MKIFKIYKKNLKNIVKNPAALVVVLGLCIIPSLYAWITLKANWDPYVDTGNVPVAIVNEDKGTILNNESLDEKENNYKKIICRKMVKERPKSLPMPSSMISRVRTHHKVE